MEKTTSVGLLVTALSLAIAAGGAGLVRMARAMPVPTPPAHRIAAGTVIELLATRCGTTSRPRGTCFRPLVAYTDQGETKHVASTTRYQPAPYRKGDRVDVFVEMDGTAWHAREWADRQARRQREHHDRRVFPLTMGWLLAGCGAFGVLLGAGLIFWVDRSPA